MLPTSRPASPPWGRLLLSPPGPVSVVVRHYILAIEAGEGVLTMLERAAALRQWGLRWHQVGVLVRRADEAEMDERRARGALGQGRIAAAGRHCRDRPRRRARALRGGGPTCRRSRAILGAVRDMMWGGAAQGLAMSSRRRRHARGSLFGRRAGSAAVHDCRRALGRRARRQADGGPERAPPRPHPLSRRRRRADGAAGPRLAVSRWRTWR